MTDVRVEGRAAPAPAPKGKALWARMRPRGGRGDRSPLGMWFWDIDRLLLLLALLLMAIGLLAVAAASPAAAVRYSDEKVHIAPLYYFWRQVMWVSVSLPVMFVVSMLPVQLARRLSLIGAGVFLLLLALVPVIVALGAAFVRKQER
jgi:cell division protein FtsW